MFPFSKSKMRLANIFHQIKLPTEIHQAMRQTKFKANSLPIYLIKNRRKSPKFDGVITDQHDMHFADIQISMICESYYRLCPKNSAITHFEARIMRTSGKLFMPSKNSRKGTSTFMERSSENVPKMFRKLFQ